MYKDNVINSELSEVISTLMAKQVSGGLTDIKLSDFVNECPLLTPLKEFITEEFGKKAYDSYRFILEPSKIYSTGYRLYFEGFATTIQNKPLETRLLVEFDESVVGLGHFGQSQLLVIKMSTSYIEGAIGKIGLPGPFRTIRYSKDPREEVSQYRR